MSTHGSSEHSEALGVKAALVVRTVRHYPAMTASEVAEYVGVTQSYLRKVLKRHNALTSVEPLACNSAEEDLTGMTREGLIFTNTAVPAAPVSKVVAAATLVVDDQMSPELKAVTPQWRITDVTVADVVTTHLLAIHGPDEVDVVYNLKELLRVWRDDKDVQADQQAA